MRSGLTIGEKRERLETANERAAARKKDKRKSAARLALSSLLFCALLVAVILVCLNLFKNNNNPLETVEIVEAKTPSPTIEIIDEDASLTGGQITSRMSEYIGTAEADLKALGLIPTRAVLPTGTIREVDFYLDGYSGFIKMTIDRDPAISAEDTERMLRYLAEQGVETFEYIDVRLDRRAYWK